MLDPLLASYGGVIEFTVAFAIASACCYSAAWNRKLPTHLRVVSSTGAILWGLSSLWIVGMVRSEIQWFAPLPESLLPVARLLGSEAMAGLLLVLVPAWVLLGAAALLYWPCERFLKPSHGTED